MTYDLCSISHINKNSMKTEQTRDPGGGKNVIHSANSPYRSGKTCLKVAQSPNWGEQTHKAWPWSWGWKRGHVEKTLALPTTLPSSS